MPSPKQIVVDFSLTSSIKVSLMDMDLIKRTGIRAAFESGKILKSYFGNISDIRKKGAIDLVTEADTASEEMIIGIIREMFPEHSILAEESGLDQEDENHQWIIDPLDGTINFAHQVPIFSISIAYAFEGIPVMGIVLNPVTGELFSAVAGEGAFLNNRPIKVSDTRVMQESLLATGFPYDLLSIFDTITGRLENCLRAAQGVRRLGSAAIDICALACGRFDGFWEQNLHPWDTAAAVLIASEAGAVITDFANKPFSIDKKEILATNGKIHTEMISLLALS
ncbi:MAG: inositol monophosphatase family protein [Desulfobacterales bacterium]|nr:inositol monophosphatase family protein [Desulfobacterales bacterium]MDX2512926.1 inositol monophosphatase family protein [Desulfobacterales bacterium]